jgi:hypothetical protein
MRLVAHRQRPRQGRMSCPAIGFTTGQAGGVPVFQRRAHQGPHPDGTYQFWMPLQHATTMLVGRLTVPLGSINRQRESVVLVRQPKQRVVRNHSPRGCGHLSILLRPRMKLIGGKCRQGRSELWCVLHSGCHRGYHAREVCSHIVLTSELSFPPPGRRSRLFRCCCRRWASVHDARRGRCRCSSWTRPASETRPPGGLLPV